MHWSLDGYYAEKVLLAMGYRVPELLASHGEPMDSGLWKTVIVPWGEVQLSQQQYKGLQGNTITMVPGVGKSYLLCLVEALAHIYK